MMIIHGLPAAAAPAHLLPWHRASFPKREPPFTRAETPASLRGCVDGHTCCHAYRGHFCMRLEGPGESRLPVVGYHLPSATFWWWSRQSQAKKHNLNGQGTYWLLYQVLHKSSHKPASLPFRGVQIEMPVSQPVPKQGEANFSTRVLSQRQSSRHCRQQNNICPTQSLDNVS